MLFMLSADTVIKNEYRKILVLGNFITIIFFFLLKYDSFFSLNFFPLFLVVMQNNEFFKFPEDVIKPYPSIAENDIRVSVQWGGGE